MKHFGDITKISGYTVPVVDVITGGSPCQDLSVAGKRAGLAGERSGLFMEQMRIVKEMRERDRRTGRTAWAIRHRFMVWENVPGAFSSGNPKGSDFAAVIEEIIKVAEQDSDVHVCVPPGGWTKSGCYYAGDGSWSIAWRVHDAQFWGVPQRRKRIALIADFGGLSAPEILFERKGLRRDTESCEEAREETAGAVRDGTKGAIIGIDVYNQEITGDIAASLTAAVGGTNTSGCKIMQVAEPIVLESNQNHATVTDDGISPTLPASMGMGGGYIPMVAEKHTISFQERAGNPGGGKGILIQEERIGALSTLNNQSVFCLQGNYIVRRLTPLECERLQGFPDGWTDIGEWIDSKGKKHQSSDSARYKALGNSIALPFWEYLAKRICAQYERRAIMGSLFDGIGGFPLAFERTGAKAVWASEIEEFPIAVTKIRFPEKETDE